MILNELENQIDIWLNEIKKMDSQQMLAKLKNELMGKNGKLTNAFKFIHQLDYDEKKIYGEKLNIFKTVLSQAFKQQKDIITLNVIQQKLLQEKLDVTLPVETKRFGGLHPLTTATRRLERYYNARGFQILDGPEIDTEFYNFDALNMGKYHPARQGHDTFYIQDFSETLLRTQTSTVQIRTMQKTGIPIRMVSIGKTYRSDCLDSTHSPMFHQMECLVVDRDPIGIGHLKNEIKKILAFFFETADIAIRLRPSYFPFTEPGVEIDCKYIKKDGRIIMTSEGDKWLEIGGAGIVHPNVYQKSGIEGTAYGYAYGMGLERMVMLKEGIEDIRHFYDTDMRFLRHYS